MSKKPHCKNCTDIHKVMTAANKEATSSTIKWFGMKCKKCDWKHWYRQGSDGKFVLRFSEPLRPVKKTDGWAAA